MNWFSIFLNQFIFEQKKEFQKLKKDNNPEKTS